MCWRTAADPLKSYFDEPYRVCKGESNYAYMFFQSLLFRGQDANFPYGMVSMVSIVSKVSMHNGGTLRVELAP